MTQQLFRIGQTEFWVLADTVEERIIETYKRSQVEADIAAIIKTLEQYPEPSVAVADLKDVLLLADASSATAARKARVKKLIRDMWASYEQDPQMVERAELAARLEREQKLLSEMR